MPVEELVGHNMVAISWSSKATRGEAPGGKSERCLSRETYFFVAG